MITLIILSFVLQKIIFTDAQVFINICFKIFGHSQQYINIPFNSILLFVPDVVRLNAVLKARSNESEIISLKNNSYILQKANHPCNEDFVYEVPATIHPFLDLRLIFKWDEQIILDALAVVIKPDFVNSRHDLISVYETIYMGIFLMHQQMPFIARLHLYFHSLPQYNTKLPKLLPEETYCMSFYTLEFKEILVLLKNPQDEGQMSKYFKFSMYIKTNKNNYFLVKSYLTKIFPCITTDNSNEDFNIFIEPDARGIRLELTDGIDTFYYISNSRNIFGWENKPYLKSDFSNLEVKVMPLNQEMVDRKVGRFLYQYKTFTRRCNVGITEDVGGFGHSFILESRVGDVILKRFIRSFDMLDQDLGVYKIRRGTEEEYQRCLNL